MPRGGPCEHPRCLGDPDGCRQLTNEELCPAAADRAFARRIINEDWRRLGGRLFVDPNGNEVRLTLKQDRAFRALTKALMRAYKYLGREDNLP